MRMGFGYGRHHRCRSMIPASTVNFIKSFMWNRNGIQVEVESCRVNTNRLAIWWSHFIVRSMLCARCCPCQSIISIIMMCYINSSLTTTDYNEQNITNEHCPMQLTLSCTSTLSEYGGVRRCCYNNNRMWKRVNYTDRWKERESRFIFHLIHIHIRFSVLSLSRLHTPYCRAPGVVIVVEKPKSLPIFVSFIKQWRVIQCALLCAIFSTACAVHRSSLIVNRISGSRDRFLSR